MHRIVFPFDGRTFGGSHVSSLILAQALAKRGHDITILTHGEGRVSDEARGRGLRTVTMPALSAAGGERADKARWEHLFALAACHRTLRTLKPDLVHLNDKACLRAWALPARLNRVPLVAHWRSNYRQSRSVDFGLRAAAAVIAISNYSADQLPAFARPKVVVEYNPFELSPSLDRKATARSEVRRRLGVPEHAVLLGVFGNFTERKRTHVLADVLAEVPATDDGRPVFGIACGDWLEPCDEHLLPKIARFGLKDRLLLPGFVSPVQDWMAACDLLLVPAEREPLGRTVFEAAALGVPAVVSSDSGAAELLESGVTGIVLDPQDVPEWISVVRGVLNDPALLRRLGAAAQATFNFSPDAHADRIGAVYARVMGHGRRSLRPSAGIIGAGA